MNIRDDNFKIAVQSIAESDKQIVMITFPSKECNMILENRKKLQLNTNDSEIDDDGSPTTILVNESL